MHSPAFDSDQDPTLSIIPLSGMMRGGVAERQDAQPTLPTWSLGTGGSAAIASILDVGSPSGSESGLAPAPLAYRLLSEVARGGMGEVWEAEQVSLGRRVAVKRLRARENDGDHERREVEFRQEAFVAASLEHPNIVPIHDLGAAGDGSPLMAMKLVEGKPWNKLIESDFPAIPEEEFLSKHIPILMSMTQAVAFAHSRGIVHRDLKPSQVLVGEFGEVLLADWGLAIEWEKPETLPTRFANARRWMPTPVTASNPAGTPALMAPEQTRTDCSGIGPWTDIYLIGATLYYLLTGTFPHSGKTAEEAMTRAAIGDVEPPSKRAPKLRIPEDLEAICLRALQRDPADRPQSAAEIWQDLDDHVRGTARRTKSRELSESARDELTKPGLGYAEYNAILATIEESRRLWSDNPQYDSLKSVALSGSVRQAVLRGDLALARLQAESITDNKLADDAMGRVQQAEARAHRRALFLRVSGAVVITLLAVIAVGSVVFSRRISGKNQQLEDRTREAERNLSIATQQGEGAHEVISFILRDLKTAMDGELTVERGLTIPVANEISHAIAGQVANPVIGYFESTDDSNWPDDLRLERARQMRETANRFKGLGRYDEAIRLIRPAVATIEEVKDAPDIEAAEFLEDLGNILLDLADFEAAIDPFKKSLDIRTAVLGANDPKTAESLAGLGTVHFHMGNYAGARVMFEDALQIAEKNPGPESELAGRFLNMLASLQLDTDDTEGARATLDRAYPILEKTLGPNHSITTQVLYNQAVLSINTNQWALAKTQLERLLAVREATLGPEHPETVIVLGQLSGLLGEMGDYEEAEAVTRRAIATNEKTLGPDHPQTGESVTMMAKLKMKKGETEEALPLYERALMIEEKTYGPIHQSTSIAQANFASILSQAGQKERAKEVAELALQTSINALGPDSEDTAYRLYTLAEIECGLKEYDRALQHLAEGFAIAENGNDIRLEALLVSVRGRIHHEHGELDEAIADYLRALNLGEQFLGPDTPETAMLLDGLANAYADLGDFEKALPYMQKMEANRVRSLGPSHDKSIYASVNVAMGLAKTGKLTEGLKKFEDTLAIANEHLGPDHPMTVYAHTYLYLFRADTALQLSKTDLTLARQEAEGALKVVAGHEHLLEQDIGILASQPILLLLIDQPDKAQVILRQLREADFEADGYWEDIERLGGGDLAPPPAGDGKRPVEEWEG